LSKKWALLAFLAFGAACSSGGPGGAGAGSDPSVPLGERVTLEGFSFQPPTRWKAEQPSSGMRLAQYRIEPVPGDSDPGECALFHFPGTGGPVQANIDRWIGQFQQPDGSSSAEHATIEKLPHDNLSITYVDISGTYMGGMSGMSAPAEPKEGYRMVAGVVEMSQGPWFMKCTGPSSTMDMAAPGLKALLRTVRG